MKLTSDIQRRLEAHLDAIDRVLMNGGAARSERRSVTDEVEGQIREMLAERTAGKPTLADLEAVFAELDPPEAYAEGAGEHSGHAKRAHQPVAVMQPPPRLSPYAITAVVLAGAGMITLMPMVQALGGPGQIAVVGGICFLLPWIGSSLLGLAAIHQIRREPHAYHGMVLALVVTLLFPLLFINFLILRIGWMIAATLRQYVPVGLHDLLPLVVVAVALGITAWIIWRTRQYYVQWAQEQERRPRPSVSSCPPPTAGPPARLSRTALLGAVWAAFFAVAFFLSFGSRVVTIVEGPPPQAIPTFELLSTLWHGFIRLVVGLPGLTAPIGTTVCGLIAISQIRHSGGRLIGMPLAVFDALLFPLLLINVLIFQAGRFAAALVMELTVHGSTTREVMAYIVIPGTWLLMVLATVVLIRLAWRAGNRPSATVARVGCKH